MKFILPLSLFAILLVCHFTEKKPAVREQGESPSEAGAAFQQWDAARLFPDGVFHTEKYSEALAAMRLSSQLRDDRSVDWEALGPANIGGRTLCLAINPLDTNILWMGSAAGGIWKSTTGGRGAAAWTRVETGFPVLGVSSLALEPGNPNVIYAGTGEVYNLENTQPNVAIRVTRGTYGIGILKSTDGGNTWQKSLDWSYGDLRAVQDIKINPKRPQTILAATTEGILRSWDAGATWHTVSAVKMAVDLEINPVDTNIVLATHGSLDDQDVSGIYRSTDGGGTFTKVIVGLPASYSGKALLQMAPSNPDIVYASIGDSYAQKGLYKSTDGGATWVLASTKDVCVHQGWYSHDVAVQPNNPNTIIWAGFDVWKSNNSGQSVQQKTYWYLWQFGEVPAGTPEGPPNYLHADSHRVYFSPNDPEKVYVVSDGGLFVSSDAGETYEGRNGGYQTQQFYANVGNSASDPNVCIGGMQDNATAIYKGNTSWYRVLGGDGTCTAISPENDQIMYGGYQYLALNRSDNGGVDWSGISGDINEDAAFNGPFEIAPSNPNILYAGAQSLWRSEDAGFSWQNISGGFVDKGNVILTIAINPTNPDEVFFSTAPTANDQPRVFKFNAATTTLEPQQGLPNRYCMDIAYNPSSPGTVYALFNGFNTQHVWKSTDSGANWAAIDNGYLPDVPTNTIAIDPAFPDVLYIGNDLGVWMSSNNGDSWGWYSDSGPQAMLVMHLSIVPITRKLRVATHGLGMWQTDLITPFSVHQPTQNIAIQSITPNPAHAVASIEFTLKNAKSISFEIVDGSGKTLWASGPEWFGSGEHQRQLPVGDLPGGTYGVVMTGGKERVGKLLVKG